MPNAAKRARQPDGSAYGKTAVRALALWLAIASPALADTLTGLWRGEYTCGQGITALRFALREDARGRVQGVMTFSQHQKNPGVPTGCYTVSGRYNARTGSLLLKQGRWIRQPDPFWYMIDFSGTLVKDGAHYDGKIVANDDGLCTTFTATRVTRIAPPSGSSSCDAADLVS